jgi:hypothetical protein
MELSYSNFVDATVEVTRDGGLEWTRQEDGSFVAERFGIKMRCARDPKVRLFVTYKGVLRSFKAKALWRHLRCAYVEESRASEPDFYADIGSIFEGLTHKSD